MVVIYWLLFNLKAKLREVTNIVVEIRVSLNNRMGTYIYELIYILGTCTSVDWIKVSAIDLFLTAL